MLTPQQVAVGRLLEAPDGAPEFVVEVIAGRTGLTRVVRSPHVQKTGLALAGFHEYIRPGRILVFGQSEIRFLESRSREERIAITSRLLEHDIPCILATAGLRPVEDLVAGCEAAGIPLLLTPTSTGTAIAAITAKGNRSPRVRGAKNRPPERLRINSATSPSSDGGAGSGCKPDSMARCSSSSFCACRQISHPLRWSAISRVRASLSSPRAKSAKSA